MTLKAGTSFKDLHWTLAPGIGFPHTHHLSCPQAISVISGDQEMSTFPNLVNYLLEWGQLYVF